MVHSNVPLGRGVQMYVLIIGGSRGFGFALADAFCSQNWHTVTVGRTGGDYRCDVGDADRWIQVAADIARDHGAFDLIVCVVGYARAKPSAELTDTDWIVHASTNLWYVETALQVIPHNRFATTGSQWSHRMGDDDLIPYIQAKHALRERTLQLGGAHYCVPPMDTPQRRDVWPEGKRPSVPEADVETIARAMARHALVSTSSETFVIDIKGSILPLKT